MVQESTRTVIAMMVQRSRGHPRSPRSTSEDEFAVDYARGPCPLRDYACIARVKTILMNARQYLADDTPGVYTGKYGSRPVLLDVLSGLDVLVSLLYTLTVACTDTGRWWSCESI